MLKISLTCVALLSVVACAISFFWEEQQLSDQYPESMKISEYCALLTMLITSILSLVLVCIMSTRGIEILRSENVVESRTRQLTTKVVAIVSSRQYSLFIAVLGIIWLLSFVFYFFYIELWYKIYQCNYYWPNDYITQNVKTWPVVQIISQLYYYLLIILLFIFYIIVPLTFTNSNRYNTSNNDNIFWIIGVSSVFLETWMNTWNPTYFDFWFSASYGTMYMSNKIMIFNVIIYYSLKCAYKYHESKITRYTTNNNDNNTGNNNVPTSLHSKDITQSIQAPIISDYETDDGADDIMPPKGAQK